MMKTYAKPYVLANDELAEGVYASSGGNTSGDCWTVSTSSEQDWNGAHHVFQVTAVHGNGEHISTVQRFKLVLNQTITDAYSNDNGATVTKVEGSTVYIERKGHGNAYGSSDQATFKVWVKAGDETTTKAIAVMSAGCTYCDHQPNVQGGVD